VLTGFKEATQVANIQDNAPGGSSAYSLVGTVGGFPNDDIEVWSRLPGGVKAGVTQVTVTFGH
jgi:hypothetical protein